MKKMRCSAYKTVCDVSDEIDEYGNYDPFGLFDDSADYRHFLLRCGRCRCRRITGAEICNLNRGKSFSSETKRDKMEARNIW